MLNFLADLSSNFTLTLGYLNPALKNSAQILNSPPSPFNSY